MYRSPLFNLSSLALVALAACQDGTTLLEPVQLAPPEFAVQPAKGVWTVTTLDDAGTGSCTSSSCTLRQAIAAAQSGEKIVFRNNLRGAIGLTQGELMLDRDLTVDGGGRIAVDARQASRVLRVTTGATVELIGLTITGGMAPGVLQVGGGIVNQGTLMLTNCTVAANQVPDGVGGGIANQVGATLTIIRSTISGNEASEIGGGIFNLGNMSVIASTISGNYSGGFGGGIFTEGPLTLRSSTITNNTVASILGGGGGIYVAVTSASLANTIVAGNTQLELGVGSDDCRVALGATISSLGYNLSPSGTGCSTLNTASDIVLSSPSQVFTEVLSPTLVNNGGPTETHALLERGRAVDAGYCPGETADQRALARPYDDTRVANARDGCDIGAFEWQPPGGPGKGKS